MKNIVICCDGTGNEYGKNNTNVVHCYDVASKNDEQITFYDPGVGTGGWEYTEEKGLKAMKDKATGEGLQKNVEDAYRYLMTCYEEGDRIYLFGFSRGAFTVRSLAGMLYKCGLLRTNMINMIDYASKICNNEGNEAIAAGFKRTFSRPCPVHFIGVWDTVDSLVMNAGKRFHNARLNPEVSCAYQALSIDEKRNDFPPYLWDEKNVVDGQTMQQVWFAGVHSDVGGWYDERGLSNIAFQWMMRNAIECGMQVEENLLAEYPGNPHDQIHESYKGFWIFRGGSLREIPEGALLHRSVAERMENGGNRYRPKNLPENYHLCD